MLANSTRPRRRRLMALAGVTAAAIFATTPAAIAATGATDTAARPTPPAWGVVNPTQITIGVPITLLFIPAAVLFIPQIGPFGEHQPPVPRPMTASDSRRRHVAP